MSREIFFRPELHSSKDWAVPIDLYNRVRKLLRRSTGNCVFVPIRNMQFQAVVDDQEIIFVDSMDYRVHQGEGGRLILVAWQLAAPSTLESLVGPVDCRLLYYGPGLDDIQRRLVGEFSQALRQLEEREVPASDPDGHRIIPFVRD